MVSAFSAFALNCVMRCSQPSGVTQVNSQASSACPDIGDWTTIEEMSGSMPEAIKSAAVSRIFAFRVEGSW